MNGTFHVTNIDGLRLTGSGWRKIEMDTTGPGTAERIAEKRVRIVGARPSRVPAGFKVTRFCSN